MQYPLTLYKCIRLRYLFSASMIFNFILFTSLSIGTTSDDKHRPIQHQRNYLVCQHLIVRTRSSIFSSFHKVSSFSPNPISNSCTFSFLIRSNLLILLMSTFLFCTSASKSDTLRKLHALSITVLSIVDGLADGFCFICSIRARIRAECESMDIARGVEYQKLYPV